MNDYEFIDYDDYYYTSRVHQSLSIGGKTYYNVAEVFITYNDYTDTLPYNYYKVLYNKDYGIIELQLKNGSSLRLIQ